jgi:hypothetical protein
LAVLPELFSHRQPQEEESRDELEAELFRQIGQLWVENEWLKKNFSSLSCGEEAVCGER